MPLHARVHRWALISQMQSLPGSQQGASSQGGQGEVPELQSHAPVPNWIKKGQVWRMQVCQSIRSLKYKYLDDSFKNN